MATFDPSTESPISNGNTRSSHLKGNNIRGLVISAGILICILLAASLYFVPEYTIYLMILAGIGIPVFLLIWARPEIGIVGMFFLTTSFLSSAEIVDIRLPFGGLDLRDLYFLFLVGVLVMRVLIQKKKFLLWGNVGLSMALFLALVFFSAFYALVLQGVDSNWALADLRSLLYYLFFFLTLWNVEDEKQLQTLVVGMFIIADLSVLVILIQQIAGADNPVLAAMTGARDWRIYELPGGGVRVMPAGHLMMHFVWMISIGLLFFIREKPRIRTFLIFQSILLGIAHILTFTRAQWVASILGLGLMAFIVLPRLRKYLPVFLTISISILLILIMVLGLVGVELAKNVPIVGIIIERFSTLLDPVETLETNSLEWRAFENQEALKSIQKHPLLGVGLGGRYRDLTTLSGEAMGWITHNSVAAGIVSRFTRYVHNSYFHVAVKMGIPGLFTLMLFIGIFMSRSWKLYQKMEDTYLRGIVLGVLMSFAGFLVWAYYHSHLMFAQSIPTIGVMTGLVGVIYYRHGSWLKGKTP